MIFPASNGCWCYNLVALNLNIRLVNTVVT
jgi:hypothetical protein